jgi:hypothetical protein
MPSRAELELRAASANVPLTGAHVNDSVLEQAVIFAEKARTASSTATVTTPTATSIQGQSGGANV